MSAERSLEGPDPSPASAPPPRSSSLPGEAVRDLQAENQAKVSGWGKGFGIGQKLARVCDSGVLQGAAETVQFDVKGLFPTAPPRLSQVRVGGRCKWWPCTHRGRAVANRCEKNRIRPTLFSEIRSVRFNPSGRAVQQIVVVKESADSYRNGVFRRSRTLYMTCPLFYTPSRPELQGCSSQKAVAPRVFPAMFGISFFAFYERFMYENTCEGHDFFGPTTRWFAAFSLPARRRNDAPEKMVFIREGQSLSHQPRCEPLQAMLR